jgi:PAS domain S-box-containing protein
MRIKTFIPRILNQLSLRFVLVIPFVIQIIMIVGVIGWLSYTNGQASVKDMATQLRQEITSHIKDKVQTFLSIPTTINHFNQSALDYHEIDVTDIDAIVRHFWRQIKFFPSLTYISYADNQGNIASAYRDFVTKELRIFLSNESTQHAHHQYATDDQGNRTALLKSVPNFDGRTRVWFKAVLAAGKPIWYPVYKYYSLDDLGVGLGTPVYTKEGNFQGMFTTDIALSQISEFLQNLHIGNSGVAFITEADGSLIASSNLQKLFTMPNNTMQRLKATENAHPLIQASAHYLQQQFPQISQITGSQQFDFTLEHQKYFLQVTPVSYEGNLNWWIVVAIPQSDFMQHIDDNTYMTLKLSILAFIIAIGVGLLTARWIVQPILTLNNAAQILATGRWNYAIPLQRDDELGQLARAFNQMAEQLRTLFTTIEANEARLKQFLEAMPIGVMVLHADGRIHYINQWATKLLGRGIEPLAYPNNLPEIYQTYLAGTRQLYPIERMPIFRALHGEVTSVDDIEIHDNGVIIPIEVWGTPLFDEQNKVLYSIAVFQDITERKQAEADRICLAQEQEAKYAALRYTHEIELKNAQLIQLNQDKNEFLGIAAHDLKNPLAGILGAAELIIESTAELSPKEVKNYAEMIAEASGQMVDLIGNLLDVNQIESQKIAIRVQQVNITAVLQKLLRNYHARATAKNIQLQFSDAGDSPVWADVNILRQVLDNIISNAIKYSPLNKIVIIQLITTETTVCCSIQDQGPGFSVEDQQKLFGKFIRLTARPTAGENSTGLGLFIVKKLVEAMRGKVWCESELGQGACFIVELPRFSS